MVLMSVLSCLFGYILPQILPKIYTEALACLLFFGFGVKLVLGTFRENEQEEDESQEAEVEVEKVRLQLTKSNNKKTDGKEIIPAFSILRAALVLTFFAEWGDRSQITTIALSAAENSFLVLLGALCGHAICSGSAVLGGKIIASKISEKMINLIGGVMFIFFGIFTAYQFYQDYRGF